MHQIDLSPPSLNALSQKYGPLVYLKLGSTPTIIISSSEVAREVFKNHDRLFSSRPLFYVGDEISYDKSDVSLAPYGHYWRELRQVMILKLLSLKRVQLFQKVRSEEVRSMLDSISHSSGPVDLTEKTFLLANNVICRAGFGKLYENSKVHTLLEETQELLAEFNIADFIPWMWWLNKINGTDKRINKCFKELDALFDKVIEDHQVDDPNDDIVTALLQIMNDPDQATPLSVNQVKGVIADIFFAGTDTTSSTIIWAMTELIRNPLMMKRAQEEVREVVKSKGMVEESDLTQLVYLKAIIKETFRLRPPVPLLLPRETLDDCTIFEYDIPTKTRVIFNTKTFMTDPKNWEKANEFWPDRFLDSEIDYKGQHFEFLPFGAGRRGCPGLNFGVYLVELGLANLLYKFDWKLPNGMNIADMDMKGTIGITVQKKIHLCLVATQFK